MKNLKTIICLLVLINVFALSCKKDSEKDLGGNNSNSVYLGIADAHEITGGSVSVKKEGSIYSVTFDATTSRGPLKGSYTGSINKE